jgi:hypothetical protein
MERKPCGRRPFVQIVGGAMAAAIEAGSFTAPDRAWDEARDVLRSGRLGRVALCRASFPSGSRDRLSAIADRVQFVMGEAPLAASWQTRPSETPGALIATFRYPTFIASFEQVRGPAERVVICGSRATLAIDAGGCSLWR